MKKSQGFLWDCWISEQRKEEKKNSGAVMMNCESNNLDTVMMKVKSFESSKKSQDFWWDCWKSLSSVFLTKKSHKIHYIQESTKIYGFLNTKRHFISLDKSQSNNNGFHCLEKKNHNCLNWIPLDLFRFYKSLDWIPPDSFIRKKSFKILWNLNPIHPPKFIEWIFKWGITKCG